MLDDDILEYCIYSTSHYKFLEKVKIDEYLHISEACFTKDVHKAIKFRSLAEAKGIMQMLSNTRLNYKVVRVYIDFTEC